MELRNGAQTRDGSLTEFFISECVGKSAFEKGFLIGVE